MATETLYMSVRSYLQAPSILQTIFNVSHVRLDIFFHTDGSKSLKQSLTAVLRSSTIVRFSWEILFSTKPQSELSHVVKSGLRGGLILSDPRPVHRPMNLSSRYSLTGRA